jgi:hypothetical protein
LGTSAKAKFADKSVTFRQKIALLSAATSMEPRVITTGHDEKIVNLMAGQV